MKTSLYSVSMWASRPLGRADHRRANALVDQALGSSAGGGQRGQRGDDENGIGAALETRQRQQRQARDQSERSERERDGARADRRNEEEGGAERADDRARGGDAVDRARHAAGALGRAQQKPDRERRIHAEKGHGEEHEGERREQAAGANVVDAGEHEFEHGRREARQHQEIGRADDHGEGQHRERGGAVGKCAAEEVARGERDQHRRDERGPGIDAAAEIRIEIARSQHLEAHHDGAGDEGDRIDHHGGGGLRRAGIRFGRGTIHAGLGGE